MSVTDQIKNIPESEKSPLVILLLEVIQQQAEEIQHLRDEIARLKGQKPKPKIKPSNLDKETDKKNKKPKKKHRKKSLKRKISKFMKTGNYIPKTYLPKANSLITRIMLFKILFL